MSYHHNFSPYFCETLMSRSFHLPFRGPTDDEIGAIAEDQPYGYKWARATPTQPGNPSILHARYFLHHWYYAFWDEDRLRNWGFEIGGPFFYSEVYSVYLDNRDGIFDRITGEKLQESLNRYGTS